MTRLEQAKLLLDFYFAPWGAAKGEVWEDISGDREFRDLVIEDMTLSVLEGTTELGERQVKLLRIVVGG